MYQARKGDQNVRAGNTESLLSTWAFNFATGMSGPIDITNLNWKWKKMEKETTVHPIYFDGLS